MNNNPKYPSFQQSVFTAGDIEQFQAKAHLSEESAEYKTFLYLFCKFKKGIFVRFREGRLDLFLPFSNAFYTNEWHTRIHQPKADTDLPVNKWFANNCLVRFENPIREGDHSLLEFRDMLATLARERTVSDVEFFLNKRDFPLLKADRTEPYDAIYGPAHPLVSHCYSTYAPILSMVEKDGFEDRAIPTAEDWIRVSNCEPGSRRMREEASSLRVDDFFSWSQKIPVAVFRGGCTSEKRLELLNRFGTNNSHFDVQLTSSISRPFFKDGRLTRLEVPGNVVGTRLTLKEQSKYKYIIHIEGHVQAFRLAAELATKSVILKVECEYRLWFENKLVPWKHYVPVRDVADLKSKLQWCLQNDAKCVAIATAAREFYERELGRESCLDRLLASVTIKREPIAPFYFSSVKIDAPVKEERSYLTCTYRARAFRRGKTPAPLGATAAAEIARFGIDVINPLIYFVPNFAFTYGFDGEGVVAEQFPLTLLDYTRGTRFWFSDWVGLLRVAEMVLSGEGEKRGRRYPEDVAVFDFGKPKEYDYRVGPGPTIVRVTSRLTPVFTNFEKFEHSFQTLLERSTRDVVKYQRRWAARAREVCANWKALSVEERESGFSFKEVARVEKTNLGKVFSIYKLPALEDAGAQRYVMTHLWLMTIPGTLARRRLEDPAKWPRLSECGAMAEELALFDAFDCHGN
jgi:hypothetical protein